MKTFRTIDGRRVTKRIPTAEEWRDKALYWAGVHLGAIAFLLTCCVAAGVV